MDIVKRGIRKSIGEFVVGRFGVVRREEEGKDGPLPWGRSKEECGEDRKWRRTWNKSLRRRRNRVDERCSKRDSA